MFKLDGPIEYMLWLVMVPAIWVGTLLFCPVYMLIWAVCLIRKKINYKKI